MCPPAHFRSVPVRGRRALWRWGAVDGRKPTPNRGVGGGVCLRHSADVRRGPRGHITVGSWRYPCSAWVGRCKSGCSSPGRLLGALASTSSRAENRTLSRSPRNDTFPVSQRVLPPSTRFRVVRRGTRGPALGKGADGPRRPLLGHSCPQVQHRRGLKGACLRGTRNMMPTATVLK